MKGYFEHDNTTANDCNDLVIYTHPLLSLSENSEATFP